MNWKYDIGEKTKLGRIVARFYKEWRNRNGGFMCGYFYEMEDGTSFNEELINP